MEVPEVAQTLACASDVLGYDVADVMLNAPAEKLNDTLLCPTGYVRVVRHRACA